VIGEYLHGAIDSRLVDLTLDNDIDLWCERGRALESILILWGGIDGVDVVRRGSQRGQRTHKERKKSFHYRVVFSFINRINSTNLTKKWEFQRFLSLIRLMVEIWTVAECGKFGKDF
jgi:hypothetical protein